MTRALGVLALGLLLTAAWAIWFVLLELELSARRASPIMTGVLGLGAVVLTTLTLTLAAML